ncbi:hypothetical protein ACQ86F_23580 [Streptomyces venezuelae ATCC 10712]
MAVADHGDRVVARFEAGADHGVAEERITPAVPAGQLRVGDERRGRRGAGRALAALDADVDVGARRGGGRGDGGLHPVVGVRAAGRRCQDEHQGRPCGTESNGT